MSGPKRYRLEATAEFGQDAWVDAFPDKNGNWVKFSDVADLIPDPAAIARAALEKAAERITDAVWLEYRDSIENKWVFRKEHVDNAIRRALADNPAALAEIVKGVKG